LKAYVQDGGTLVAEARLGWNDERGHASERIPGMGLWELMGCRETAVQVGAGGKTELRWTASEIPGIQPGDILPGRWFEETLEPVSTDARIVARFADGAPAAVVSHFGHGKTLMLGSYLSAAYETSPSPAAARFFAALLEWAGISGSGAGNSLPQIEIRTSKSGPDSLVFFFNHGNQAADLSFPLPPGAYRATDLVTEQPVEPVRDGASLRLKKPLPPSDVWVLKLAGRR